MLTGKELGAAVRKAVQLKAEKGVSQVEIARHFDVKPPSVQDWMNKGTIGKDKLPLLWDYFSDVVGPEHWGLREYPHQHLSRGEWPFRSVELKKVLRLSHDQREQLQGAMIFMLGQLEMQSKGNVRKLRSVELVK